MVRDLLDSFGVPRPVPCPYSDGGADASEDFSVAYVWVWSVTSSFEGSLVNSHGGDREWILLH